MNIKKLVLFWFAPLLACVSGIPARADICQINPPGTAPTFGAFAEGGINNTPPLASCNPGVSTNAYYVGTDINPFTYANSSAVGSASGAIGTAASGMSSASADLASGNISVSASSTGSPAGSEAGYFVQIVFSGGSGLTGSFSTGGLISYSANVSANAGATLELGTSPLISPGFSIVSGNALPATVDQPWSTPVQTFTIQDGVIYTFSNAIRVGTSGSFLPGSATMTDPVFFNLPPGVTFTASDPQFLTGAVAPVPEPSSFLLLGTGLFGLVAARRRKPLAQPRRRFRA